jgi:hemoglobin/transferrin/lactoferrin receptor protein
MGAGKRCCWFVGFCDIVTRAMAHAWAEAGADLCGGSRMLSGLPGVCDMRHLTTAMLFVTALAAEDAAPPAVPRPADVSRDGLDTITVTASRTAEALQDAPQAVTVLTAKAIAERQSRTPTQMLSEEPGIWAVQVNTQGSPILRGQIGNRVLYLWDGVRLNNGALFGGPNGYFNQFPVGSVERMEVLLGPGAVQYGSDAIGGTINIISKAADPFAAAQGTHGRVGYRYGTGDHEQTTYGDITMVGDRVALSAGLSGQNVEDYTGAGVGEIENTGFEAFGGHAALGLRVTDDQTLRLSFVGNRREDVESYSQSKLNSPGVPPRLFNPYEQRWIAKASYEIEHLGTGSERLLFTAYREDYSQQRVTTRENGAKTEIRATTADSDQEVTGFGVQNTGRVGSIRLTSGADARFERLDASQSLLTTVKSTGATSVSVPTGSTPDGTYDVMDAFAIADAPLGNDLTLRVGARYEQIHLDSDPVAENAVAPYTSVEDMDLDKTWRSPTASIGLIWDMDPSWSLAGNVATGFRAPTFSDVLSVGTVVFSSTAYSLPSPDVEPERSITYELSLRHESDAAWGRITGYYTDIRDLIVREADGTISTSSGDFTAFRKKNSGHAMVTGVESEFGYHINANWTIFANGTYTYGQDLETDDALRFIPPLNGLVGTRWDALDRRWWTEGVVVLVDRMHDHAPDDESDAGFSTDPGLGSPNSTTNPPYRSDWKLPGYAVVNLRVGWTVAASGFTSLSLTADLNNVLDQEYREAYAQQQLVAPGRNLVIGIEGTF